MFVTNHVASGATIGLGLKDRPLSAFLAGVASHFVLDAAPHWGLEASDEREGSFLRVAKRDGVTGLALVAGILLLAPRGVRLSVAAGIAGAVLPDMDKPVQHFFGRVLFPERFNRFHAGIQTGDRKFLVNEVLVGAVFTGLVATMVYTAHQR